VVEVQFTPTRVGKRFPSAVIEVRFTPRVWGRVRLAWRGDVSTRFTPTRVGKSDLALAVLRVVLRFTPTRVGKR
jgi:hypothetical protein